MVNDIRWYIIVLVISSGNTQAGLYKKGGYVLTDGMQKTIHAMVNVNRHLFTSYQTYEILCAAAPCYLMGRIVDKPLQNYFYDKKRHRNIHQLAPVFTYGVDPLLFTTFGVLIALQGLTTDPEAALISNSFLAVFPFLFLYKNILKQMPIKGSLRPKNAHFSACKKYYGGFPSGHMLEISCAAYLFGSSLGINYALPLSACAFLVALQSVVSNRHTCSQVIAGAALGCMFGAAAKHVVSDALHHKRTYGIMIDRSGKLSLSVETSF